MHLSMMRSDGETFSLNERARNAGEFFPRLFFRCVQRWQEVVASCLRNPRGPAISNP